MKKQLVTFSIIFLFIFVTAAAENEAQIAESIIDITNNLEWSANGPQNGEKIILGVVGESAVTGELEKLAASASVEIRIKAFTDDMSDCHIVYTPTTDLKNLAKVLKQAAKAKLVTISSAKDFARYGVMINLMPNGGKLDFEINKMVLDDAGVKLDSKILKKATII